MAKPLGKVIYCSQCVRDFCESNPFPDVNKIRCQGCLSVIWELWPSKKPIEKKPEKKKIKQPDPEPDLVPDFSLFG